MKQLDARCAELREAGAAHEHRAAEATAELSRSNHVVERLTADLQTSRDKLKRKQAIIVRQVRPRRGRLAGAPPACACILICRMRLRRAKDVSTLAA